MRLSAALVPPPLVLEDLSAVVRSVGGAQTELEQVPSELVHISLGRFGNVGLTDRMALQEVLKEEVACWAPLQLRFKGGSALVDPGDDSLWAELDGDLEQLVAMGTVIPRVVQRLGFLIDRRTFRTRVRVGRITPRTTLPFLERMLARLDGYAGPAWTAHHVSLLRTRSGDESGAEVDVLHDLRLIADTQTVGAAEAPRGRHRAPEDSARLADSEGRDGLTDVGGPEESADCA